MILGRPVNSWLGLINAAIALLVLVLAALVPPIIIPALIVTAFQIFLGLLIAFVANTPPVVNEGAKIKVVTPEGQPNYEIRAKAA